MPQSTGATHATNSTLASTAPYQSVRDYTAAKQAGDSLAAAEVCIDALGRLNEGTISADEYNALTDATTTYRLGGAR